MWGPCCSPSSLCRTLLPPATLSSLVPPQVHIRSANGSWRVSLFNSKTDSTVVILVQSRLPLPLGGISAALFNVLIVAWQEFVFAVIMRFFTGLSIALVYPQLMRIVSTWFKKGRGLALGVLITAFCVGSAAPHLINGFQANSQWAIILYPPPQVPPNPPGT